MKTATLTVIGRDKTGVVARITGFLFAQKGNIEALEEQVTRGQFSMTVQTSWKDKQLDRGAVIGGLDKLARDLQMEIKVRFTESRRRQRMAMMVTPVRARKPHSASVWPTDGLPEGTGTHSIASSPRAISRSSTILGRS